MATAGCNGRVDEIVPFKNDLLYVDKAWDGVYEALHARRTLTGSETPINLALGP